VVPSRVYSSCSHRDWSASCSFFSLVKSCLILWSLLVFCSWSGWLMNSSSFLVSRVSFPRRVALLILAVSTLAITAIALISSCSKVNPDGATNWFSNDWSGVVTCESVSRTSASCGWWTILSLRQVFYGVLYRMNDDGCCLIRVVDDSIAMMESCVIGCCGTCLWWWATKQTTTRELLMANWLSYKTIGKNP